MRRPDVSTSAPGMSVPGPRCCRKSAYWRTFVLTLPAYSVEKLGFACVPQANRAYETSALRSACAGPTAIEIAPASLCVALKAIDATRATCDLQLDFRRPHV